MELQTQGDGQLLWRGRFPVAEIFRDGAITEGHFEIVAGPGGPEIHIWARIAPGGRA